MIGGTLVLRELAREKYSRAIGERQKNVKRLLNYIRVENVP